MNTRKSTPIATLLACCAMAWLPTTQAAEARTLETAFGPVAISGSPSRVVTLDEGALDAALALGVQPIGSVSTRGSTGVSTYLAERAGSPAIVGTSRAPSVEAVLKLKPDLILAGAGTSAELHAVLSKIAPTVVAKSNAMGAWQDSLKFQATALGREAEAEKLLTALSLRIEALKARVSPGQHASIVRWMPQGPMAMSSHAFAGQLLGQVGLTGTELAASLSKKPHSDILSLENLSKVDADWLFLASLNNEGSKTLEAARQQPAFERLRAVQNQHAVVVDGQVWSSGSGPLAAAHILDDLERTLPRP